MHNISFKSTKWRCDESLRESKFVACGTNRLWKAFVQAIAKNWLVEKKPSIWSLGKLGLSETMSRGK